MACRTARPKRDLIRVVRTPAGSVELDATGRLAGRGAYLCADGACWRAAAEKGALARALAAPLPDGFRERLLAGVIDLTTTKTTSETTTGGANGGEE